MREENLAIIKALNMYGRVPEQWELLNEIERLKDLCNKYEEEHKTTFEEWKKSINIIKEVREYIEKASDNEYSYGDYEIHYEVKKELLEILGGENNDK